ncbi:putative lipase atg15, partial [Nowakowskiella sp. JEL0078]
MTLLSVALCSAIQVPVSTPLKSAVVVSLQNVLVAESASLPLSLLSLAPPSHVDSESPQNFSLTIKDNLPDMLNPHTVLSLARISQATYIQPKLESDSYKSLWESGRIKGYIFANTELSLVILAFQGLASDFRKASLSQTDISNLNMMFSCCNAHFNFINWKTYDCQRDSRFKVCDSRCVSDRSNFDDSYYNIVQSFFTACRQFYPNANLWFTGHSTGGSFASLVGITQGIPAIAFQSPGDLLFSARIGLTTSNLPQQHIWHIGNDYDPIFRGLHADKQVSFETGCHVGSKCVYREQRLNGDDKSNIFRIQKWDAPPPPKVNIYFHSISVLIERFLERATEVPECISKSCVDCGEWLFREEVDDL